MSQASRSAAIDTFRGLGVTLVVWTHAGMPGAPGAYITIDCFFVLSGYLITRSFLMTHAKFVAGDAGKTPPTRFQAYKKTALLFMEGRIRRILFPLFLTLLLTLIAGWAVLLPADLFDLAEAAFMAVLLSGNLHAAATGDYFEIQVAAEPLLHTWSLALEEQFYLFSLLVLALIVLVRSRLVVWAGILLLCAASLGTAEYYSTHPELKGQSYYLFITRIWEFLVGVALAPLIVYDRLEGRIGRALTHDASFVLGWVLVAVSIVVLTPSSPSPGVVSVPAIIGICLIVLGRPLRPFLAQGMHSRYVMYVGKNIYGIYLLHFPVIILISYMAPPWGAWHATICFVLSYAFSIAVGALIEQPFDRWRRPRFRSILVLDGVILAAVLGIVGVIFASGGAPQRLSEPAVEAYAAKIDVNPHRARCLTGELTDAGYSCVYNAGLPRKVVLIGDSHSDALANPLATYLAERNTALHHYWFAECAPISSQLFRLNAFPDTCERLSFEAQQDIARQGDFDAVVFAVLWPWYLGYAPGDTPEVLLDDRESAWDAEAVATYQLDFVEAFKATVQAALSRGATVFIQAPVPIHDFSPPEAHALNAWYRPEDWVAPLNERLTVAAYERQRVLFEAMVQELLPLGDVRILDPREALCTDTHCQTIIDGASVYYDDNHLNERGAERLVAHFFPR